MLPPPLCSSLTASSLCKNPCWESAASACEFKHHEEMRGAAQHKLGVSEDFCAVSEGGAYCRDLYRQKGGGGATWDCDTLQVSQATGAMLPWASLEGQRRIL